MQGLCGAPASSQAKALAGRAKSALRWLTTLSVFAFLAAEVCDIAKIVHAR
jgi:hypothetical protein